MLADFLLLAGLSAVAATYMPAEIREKIKTSISQGLDYLKRKL